MAGNVNADPSGGSGGLTPPGPEERLMQAVKSACGPALAAFAPSSSVPESFWAALTANESGADLELGNSIDKILRREPAVYQHLAMVAGGFQPRYGSLTATDFDHAEDQTLARPIACHEPFARQAPSLLPANTLKTAITVDDLLRWSTSWGWTQLMGYHALEWGIAVSDLWSPAMHYPLAARLMAGFVKQYQLDPKTEFEQMARCWNTGRPDGATYDPKYVQNLLARMEEWEKI